ncbi:MAG: tyrosine-type recombinase/integrase [Burkholderiales bacterium]
MNVTIKDAMDAYTVHLRAKGRAERTVANCIQPVKHLWREVGEINVTSLRPQHVDRMFQRHDWSVVTRNLYIGNLKGFVKYCRRMGYCPKDFDFMDGWESSRVPRQDKLIIPPEEFASLLDAARNPRDRALIAVGLFTFCRSSEVCTIRVGDLDFDRHTVAIYRWKTSQPDILPMCSELETEMLRWFAYYSKEVGGLQSSYYLIPALAQIEMTYDRRLCRLVASTTPQALRPTSKVGHPYEPVQRALATLGYPTGKTGGHTLRRSGARALFDQCRSVGYDGALRHVASMLGHSDTKVTENYLGLGIERMQRNELLAGKPMLPNLVETLPVARLEAVR